MREGQRLTGTAVGPTGCLLCGAGGGVATGYGREPYRILRCPECRLWYIDPLPSAAALAALYADDAYFAGGAAGYADYRGQARSLRTTLGGLLDRLARRGVTGGALLEVGSGLGYLLDEARAYFPRRVGIELAPAAAAEASARAGAPVLSGLEALDPAARFDCILATHVIEHVSDPVGFTRDLAGRLRRGGALVLAAPDMDSPLRRLMGRRWPSFKYPEHLAYYDRRTLPRLLETAGLVTPERIPYPHAFPLTLILGKLGLPAPAFTGRIDVTVPGTTICVIARRSAGQAD